MKLQYKTYLVGCVAFTIALFTVAFSEMYDHGWLTQPEASVLSFVLGVWVILTCSVLMADVLRIVFQRFRPHPPGAIVIGAGIVAGFALVFSGTVPTDYRAEALRLGAVVGVIPALEFVLYTTPVVTRVERVQERLEDRGVIG